LVKCGPPKLAGPVRLHCSHSPKATTGRDQCRIEVSRGR